MSLPYENSTSGEKALGEIQKILGCEPLGVGGRVPEGRMKASKPEIVFNLRQVRNARRARKLRNRGENVQWCEDRWCWVWLRRIQP